MMPDIGGTALEIYSEIPTSTSLKWLSQLFVLEGPSKIRLGGSGILVSSGLMSPSGDVFTSTSEFSKFATLMSRLIRFNGRSKSSVSPTVVPKSWGSSWTLDIVSKLLPYTTAAAVNTSMVLTDWYKVSCDRIVTTKIYLITLITSLNPLLYRTMQFLTYGQRAHHFTNPAAKQLLNTMERKRSNLCVSVDVPTKQGFLQVIDTVGPYVALIKVNKDTSFFAYILENFLQ